MSRRNAAPCFSLYRVEIYLMQVLPLCSIPYHLFRLHVIAMAWHGCASINPFSSPDIMDWTMIGVTDEGSLSQNWIHFFTVWFDLTPLHTHTCSLGFHVSPYLCTSSIQQCNVVRSQHFTFFYLRRRKPEHFIHIMVGFLPTSLKTIGTDVHGSMDTPVLSL